MIRKIAAQALCPGMYVHDLGCSWVDHPFLLNRFVLRTDAEIRKILDAGISEVLIDTERGADLAAPAAGRERPAGSQVSATSPSPVGRARASAPAAKSLPEAQQCNGIQPSGRDGIQPSGRDGIQPSGRDGIAAPASPRGTGARDARSAGAIALTAPPAKSRRAAPAQDVARPAAGGEPIPVDGGDPARSAGGKRAPVPAGAAQGADAVPQAGMVKSSDGPLAMAEAAPAETTARPGQAPAVPAESTVSAALRIANEFKEAKRVHAESCRVVREILNDARLGKQVCIERTRTVVTRMAQSILRNPGPLLALCRIKQKDDYTFQHCVSVGALLMVFGRAAGLDEATTQEAGLGGLLHDIGKMTIPAEMLNKPGMLTEREVAIMRRHVAAGTEMLRSTPGISAIALQVAAEHHERHDGTGYPMGLKADAISHMGRMAAIVDVYDAITSDRVYHRGLTPAEALKLLFEGSGSHFDPQLVQLLIRTLGIYPTGSLVMLESGRLAIVVEQSSERLLQPRVRVVYDTRKASFVPPFDVDLARTAGHGGEDRIAHHESPQKWSVDPLAYLLREVA